jgi:hypothetical protein
MGGCRPVLVVAADTMDAHSPFAEFYVFHQFPDLPFLHSRTSCAHADALYLYDFGQYPEVFSAKALFDSEFREALDHIEHEVSMRDRGVANELFHSGTPIVFEETGNLPLIEFAIFNRFAKERETMFKFSRSHALHLLKEKLLGLPEAILNHEPKR